MGRNKLAHTPEEIQRACVMREEGATLLEIGTKNMAEWQKGERCMSERPHPLKNKARRFRLLGASVSEVARNCDILEATAFAWTRDVVVPKAVQSWVDECREEDDNELPGKQIKGGRRL